MAKFGPFNLSTKAGYSAAFKSIAAGLLNLDSSNVRKNGIQGDRLEIILSEKVPLFAWNTAAMTISGIIGEVRYTQVGRLVIFKIQLSMTLGGVASSNIIVRFPLAERAIVWPQVTLLRDSGYWHGMNGGTLVQGRWIVMPATPGIMFQLIPFLNFGLGATDINSGVQSFEVME